ncbi:hypothetical protein MTsPCn9_16830 [Croceitalea sp. MTPC9]|uniref:hypothetical protein n=1 Tax=unclassified Croceitalea TaxID=2632280 RepID=UPI002B39D76D|nr:hypothetical protein MTsPCn6_09680 [Croceitalea sp. MTPC6]GMN16747.1 hypothetical protein MTsPCn9_16830 [Croceitalea sp. MTPC9]
MNIAQKSIFNLIEIFRTSGKPTMQIISTDAHFEQKHHHDFYCDAEKPFIENLNK